MGWLWGLFLLGLVVLAPPSMALTAADFPSAPPVQERVVDQAEVFSRAAAGELNRHLSDLTTYGVEANLVTLGRVDYGSTPTAVATDLLERWQHQDPQERLVALVETRTGQVAVVASPALAKRLPPSLLDSTAEDTMAGQLRRGEGYRLIMLRGIQRLDTVLAGGKDPGPPVLEAAMPAARSNVPSHEETSASNALTWVAVLLGLGTVIPMLTWWVFSR
ncbi:MAG: TPM domain-containing protein [Synechococcus sp. SB0666_bin_14]|nr:TPM domain-containing protein [Synechococcus sp. SB0666_bin_14]MYG46625.1 TPM domain-containing protein [Synechococcus sp. SB0675_bin_6]